MKNFIKDFFNNVKVKCNDQELVGLKKVLALIFSAAILILALGISVVMIVVAICIIPIGMVIKGIQLLVPLIKDLLRVAKMKRALKKRNRRQTQQLSEVYIKNRDSINNTIEALENSTSIIEDEYGREVEAQELVNISFEDIDCYIEYIAQFNSNDAGLLKAFLSRLEILKSSMDTTLDSEEQKKFENLYNSIMFAIQEKMIEHIEENNSMNDKSDKNQKKRRLFNKNL